LDVGCGQGALLDRLAGIGFTNVLGVDPFVEKSFTTDWGAKVIKQSIEEVTGEFDVIMFHHSLEHVPDPAATLRHANSILATDGICYIRVPTPSSEAFEIYGADWVQLDAPRHLGVPSRDGMAQIAGRCGFRVAEVIDDSRGFGFWGSELYRKGIHLNPGGRGEANPLDHFASTQLGEWEERAARLNEIGRGDQAAFILRRDTV
jgi:SAM-dependent methyltransferase